jgi:hypothetical protein
MKSRSFHFEACVAFAVLFFFSAGASMVHAGQTCMDSAENTPECQGTNSPCVCVQRDDITPVEGLDFVFDVVTDPSNPDVTFKTGSSTYAWRVWSQEHASDTTPDNLGDLAIDSTGSTDDYLVEIQNPNTGGAGAENLGSAVLLDATNWTGYSSITGGTIGVDLTGDLTLVAAGAEGGELDLWIAGSAAGSITAPIVKHLSIVKLYQFGSISAEVVEDLSIVGLSGDVAVSNKVD